MNKQIWFPIFLLTAFLILIVHGLSTLSLRAMRFPVIIGGIAVVLLLVEVIRGVMRARSGEGSKEAESRSLKELASHLPALAMLLAIAPLIWFLGFLVAVPVHVFFFLKFNGEKWSKSFIAALVIGIIFYFGLYLGMNIPFNEGLLFSYLLG